MRRFYDGELSGCLGKIQSQIVKCKACSRLVAFREKVALEKRPAYQGWEYWGAPVPSLGDPKAELLVIGLAPGAHGANRTGRMFTGDSSASFLTAALYKAGFASGASSLKTGDGLRLKNIYISSALHCVPPNDKATMVEQDNCRVFLKQELNLLKGVRAVLTLGAVAFSNYLKAISSITGKRHNAKFQHNSVIDTGEGSPRLFCSYHPSPRNTNTGRLTVDDLDTMLSAIRLFLLKPE